MQSIHWMDDLQRSRLQLRSVHQPFEETTMSLINTPIQPFNTTAFIHRGGKGEFIEATADSLKVKWSVLIFMPAAFTFNCPTEIEDAAEHYAEFQKAGAEVYIVNPETHFSHKVWHETS